MTAFEPSIELVPGLSAQIEKIVNHELFKGSEALRRILLYLGEHAAQNPGRPTREYEIAIHVLGRSEDFDARADSAFGSRWAVFVPACAGITPVPAPTIPSPSPFRWAATSCSQ